MLVDELLGRFAKECVAGRITFGSIRFGFNDRAATAIPNKRGANQRFGTNDRVLLKEVGVNP